MQAMYGGFLIICTGFMLSPRLLAAPQTNDILVEVVDVKASTVLMTGWRKAPLISEMLAARVIPPELGVCLSETVYIRLSEFLSS